MPTEITKELYEELAISKQIEKDAKDEIIAIRTMSFEDWQKKNEKGQRS